MGIQKRPDSPYWWYDFTLDGRRFRGSTETEDRKTAEIIVAKLRADILIGAVTGRKPRLTLDEAFARYWLDHAHCLASAPTLEYQGEALLDGLGKATRLDELTDGAVATYVAKRRGTVSTRKRLFSDASINRELTLLRAVLSMARDRWGVEVATINWKRQALREPAPRERYLTEDDAAKLIEACPQHLRGPVLFAIYTGARLANVATLDWSQIDMKRREVTFLQKSHAPGGKPHVVTLAEPAFLMLANQGPQPAGAVWWYKGRPLRSWKRSFKTALKTAGIKDFRWHDLRHTAASWLVQAGAPLDVVQKILGHSVITTTQRYAHRANDATRVAVDAMPRIRHVEGSAGGAIVRMRKGFRRGRG